MFAVPVLAVCHWPVGLRAGVSLAVGLWELRLTRVVVWWQRHRLNAAGVLNGQPFCEHASTWPPARCVMVHADRSSVG